MSKCCHSAKLISNLWKLSHFIFYAVILSIKVYSSFTVTYRTIYFDHLHCQMYRIINKLVLFSSQMTLKIDSSGMSHWVQTGLFGLGHCHTGTINHNLQCITSHFGAPKLELHTKKMTDFWNFSVFPSHRLKAQCELQRLNTATDHYCRPKPPD